MRGCRGRVRGRVRGRGGVRARGWGVVRARGWGQADLATLLLEDTAQT